MTTQDQGRDHRLKIQIGSLIGKMVKALQGRMDATGSATPHFIACKDLANNHAALTLKYELIGEQCIEEVQRQLAALMPVRVHYTKEEKRFYFQRSLLPPTQLVRCTADADGVDEIVVGDWLHLEAMDTKPEDGTVHYHLRIGDRSFAVFIEKGGKVASVEQD